MDVSPPKSTNPALSHVFSVQNTFFFGSCKTNWTTTPLQPLANASVPFREYFWKSLALTFGRDVSPGDCWVWPARGYAGETDVAAFVDGDVRGDLGDFRGHCNDTER